MEDRADSAPAELDREAAERRFHQLALRLRMCAVAGSDLHRQIRQELQQAEGSSDPLVKLADLRDFAAKIRPQLPEAVAAHTLPEGLTP